MKRWFEVPIGPRIEGARIFLRGLTVDDVGERYLGWLDDPEVSRFLETRHAEQSLETIRAFVAAKAASADETLFGIFLSDGGRHVGNIKLGPVKAHHRLAEVSLLLGERAVWGQGLGSEAIGLVTGHAFDALGLNKVTASMYGANEASARAFEKAGWLREARLAGHYLLDGRPDDLIVVGCTAARWQALKGQRAA